MTKHEQLFEHYVKELCEAKEFSERWWKNLVKSERSKAKVPEEADKRLRRRWPDGPASHPRVLAVVRKYWLACDALNGVIARDSSLNEDEPGSKIEYVLAPSPEPEEGKEYSEEEAEEVEENEVDPHIFVLEWLMDGDHDELGDFLGSLTYWPIGLDQDDRYT